MQSHIEHDVFLAADSILKKPVKTSMKGKILSGVKASNKIQSFDHFREEIHSNEMLNGLKYFEKAIVQPPHSQYKGKPAFDWGEVDRNSLAGCILSLCTRVRDIMAHEPRLLEIQPPVYIMGTLNFFLCYAKTCVFNSLVQSSIFFILYS